MGVKTAEVPLLGLLNEALFTGEERELKAPPLDAPALSALAKAAPKQVVIVSVAATAEVPTFIIGRWGTLCDVMQAAPGALTVKALSRVRVTATSGRGPLYDCSFDRANDVEDSTELLKHTLAVFEALARGAEPTTAHWASRVRDTAASALRAVSTPAALRHAETVPLAEALALAADALASDIPVGAAVAGLEKIFTDARARGISDSGRRRLWAQLVEVQKALDVYDVSAGDNVDDLLRLQRRLQQAGLPKEVNELAKRELRMLRGMESSHHDFSTYFHHLDFIARLSWHPETLPPIDLDKVAEALDREHAGLEKPKRRVLEQLAVHALDGSAKNMIICLAGPPGVGKTTIARVIAESLSRKFVRVPLGGVHDEAEIRGHRKSFTAAGPGRLLEGFARVKSATPVVLLDEIDKIGTDTQRSPAAALLEVLDPEQNKHFSDNFLAAPYDLSHALFICTANDVSRIHPIVLDRLELIELDGYTTEEKVSITRKHVLERTRVETGLPTPLQLSEERLVTLIEEHTREAGVRQLQRAIAALYRDKAYVFARARTPVSMDVSADDLVRVLGPKLRARENAREKLPPGTAQGLSVDGQGGSLLFIEAVALPGSGDKLRLTGRLGEVLRESAITVLAHLRANPERHGISPGALDRALHVHLPDAATPKDGPSAGLALACAFISLARGVALPGDVAMTGEVTLSGQVMPVGGVRAKLLAADRAGVRRVLIPKANLSEVPAGVRAKVIGVEQLSNAVRELFG